MKVFELTPVFSELIPERIEEGILYISLKYGAAVHLCACGCGERVATELQPIWKNGWSLQQTDNKITLRPSIGNFNGEHPYHAHYHITNNKIEWL